MANSTLAVVGNETFTLGFRLVGIRKIWNAATEEELERAVARARQDPDVSILVMETSDLNRMSSRTRHELVGLVRPTVDADGLLDLVAQRRVLVGVDLW
ncbi:MAG TPA: V-type ATP synthase subunit F [Candidatus Thermoplasmatota archaeon]|nr:V-type ATP synthase subunit F [Candidatus Thermoplasmatota archaeon]